MIICAKDFLNIAAIALGAVADEDFIAFYFNATSLVIVLDNGIGEETVTLFRPIAAEGIGAGQFIYGLVHSLNAGRRQGLGNIANAQANDICFRISFLKGCHSAGDFRKEITAGEFQVIVIDCSHINLQ